MPSDLACLGVHDGNELEQFGGQPHRLLAVLRLPYRATAQLGEIPVIGLFPKHRAIALHNAGHFGKPRREFGLELAVLLVDWRELARRRLRFPRKATEIPIFVHLGIVDVPLTTDPLQQDLRLCGGWVTAKTISDLHECDDRIESR